MSGSPAHCTAADAGSTEPPKDSIASAEAAQSDGAGPSRPATESAATKATQEAQGDAQTGGADLRTEAWRSHFYYNVAQGSPLVSSPFSLKNQPAPDVDRREANTAGGAAAAQLAGKVAASLPASVTEWTTEHAYHRLGAALKDADRMVEFQRVSTPCLPPGQHSAYIRFAHLPSLSGPPLTLALGADYLNHASEFAGVLSIAAEQPPHAWMVGDEVTYVERVGKARKQGVLLGITVPANGTSYNAWLCLPDHSVKSVRLDRLQQRVSSVRIADLVPYYAAIAHPSVPATPLPAAAGSERGGKRKVAGKRKKRKSTGADKKGTSKKPTPTPRKRKASPPPDSKRDSSEEASSESNDQPDPHPQRKHNGASGTHRRIVNAIVESPETLHAPKPPPSPPMGTDRDNTSLVLRPLAPFNIGGAVHGHHAPHGHHALHDASHGHHHHHQLQHHNHQHHHHHHQDVSLHEQLADVQHALQTLQYQQQLQMLQQRYAQEKMELDKKFPHD